MQPRLRASVYIGLVFLCGLVAGALARNVYEHMWLHPGGVHAAPRWSEARGHVLEQMKSELNLNPEQARQFERILDDTMREFDDLHARSHLARLQCKERIRSILTDQQRQKFEDAMARLQKRYGIQE